MTWERFSADLEFSHQRCWPGQSVRWPSSLRLLIGSRGLWLLALHRISHWWLRQSTDGGTRGWRLRLISIPLTLLEWLMKVVTKSDILGRSDIEGGVCLHNEGGIILGAKKIGSGTVIGPRTTIGMNLADRGLPEIGDNVWIGPDCIVYGAVTIGEGATLLPGTTLTKSIPAGVVMQGNPARLVLRNFDNTALRRQPEPDVSQHMADARGN